MSLLKIGEGYKTTMTEASFPPIPAPGMNNPVEEEWAKHYELTFLPALVINNNRTQMEELMVHFSH